MSRELADILILIKDYKTSVNIKSINIMLFTLLEIQQVKDILTPVDFATRYYKFSTDYPEVWSDILAGKFEYLSKLTKVEKSMMTFVKN
jgi:hypothetical protein